MLSDVLFEADQEIRRYLEEFPETYEFLRPAIQRLLTDMAAIRTVLDRHPDVPTNN